MTDEPALHVILPHPGEIRILALPDDDGWTLPSLQTDAQTDDAFDLFEVGMNDTRSLLDCAVESLHCPYFAPANNEHGFRFVFVMNNLDPAFQPPSGARWLNVDEVDTVTPDYLRPVLESWFRERSTGIYPPERPPWAFPSWLNEAKTWIGEQVAANDWQLTGEIELVRKWCITCVMKTPTSAGDLYFKAVPPTFAREIAVTRLLSELHPGNIPTIVAADDTRRWLLLRDFGQSLLGDSQEAAHWEHALRDFAAIQVSMTHHIDALLARGALDYRLETLPEKLDALLADDTILKPDRFITADEIERVRRLAPRIKSLIQELADCNLPPTVVHSDFHLWNIAVQGERTIFFDWTDASVGHPFFDMAFVFSVMTQRLFPETPDVVATVREIYLQGLTPLAPRETLRKALPLGELLGLVHQAVNYRHLLRSVEPAERWTLDYTGSFMKKLLTRLEEPENQ